MRVTRFLITAEPENGAPADAQVDKGYSVSTLDDVSLVAGGEDQGLWSEVFEELGWVPFSVREMLASGLAPWDLDETARPSERPYLFEVRDEAGKLVGTSAAITNGNAVRPGVIDYWSLRLGFKPSDAAHAAQARESLLTAPSFQIIRYLYSLDTTTWTTALNVHSPAQPAGDTLMLETPDGSLAEALVPYTSLAELVHCTELARSMNDWQESPSALLDDVPMVVAQTASEVAELTGRLLSPDDARLVWSTLNEVTDTTGRHLMTQLCAQAPETRRGWLALDEALTGVDPAELDIRRGRVRMAGARPAGRGILD